MSSRVTQFPFFTLLVTLTILTTSSQASAKRTRISGDFNSLGAAVRIYKTTTGILPDPELGLGCLVHRPASLPPQARWTQLLDEVPTDPWGIPYSYVAGDGYPSGFGFYSPGKDGISRTQGNDPDDINSWSEESREPLIDLKLHWKTAGFLIFATLTIGFLIGKIRYQRRINPA
ncbi:type II secretion system protein GspG [Haloferula chungangensis]|uniref:Type II secretion system protein GspG n=1 Tax=Haloferula chungangensis TaxID=1048331 RepID=A0ABW2L3N8_9BACT